MCAEGIQVLASQHIRHSRPLPGLMDDGWAKGIFAIRRPMMRGTDQCERSERLRSQLVHPMVSPRIPEARGTGGHRAATRLTAPQLRCSAAPLLRSSVPLRGVRRRGHVEPLPRGPRRVERARAWAWPLSSTQRLKWRPKAFIVCSGSGPARSTVAAGLLGTLPFFSLGPA